MKSICITLLVAGGFAMGQTTIDLTGPDGKLKWTLNCDGGKVTQALEKSGKTILQPGALGLVVDGANIADGTTGFNVVKGPDVKVEFPVVGKKSKGTAHYKQYRITGKGSNFVVDARVYDDAVAFRYVWSGRLGKKNEVKVDRETSSFKFPEEAILWTQDGKSALGPCEGVWEPSRIGDFKVDKNNPNSYVRTAPITVELPGGGYAFIQEAGNFGLNWSGIKFALEDGECRSIYYHDQEGFKVKPKGAQPWRVILVADDLNTLANSDVIDSLVSPPDKKLFPQGPSTSWIKPGRSSWTWWATRNARNGDQYKYTDMAADFGWEYHLVDEGWKKWDKSYQKCLSMMKELTDYAGKKGIGIWAWIRWSEINNPDNNWQQMRTFIEEMKKAGVVGLKVDFMDSASQERLHFYDAMLENTAKSKIMINFHGANTPGGEPRQWPHEMSREGIYGGEQNLWSTIPGQHYAALPFTRMISGHGDYTGGYFGHGRDLKGSSWALQMASNIIFTSPALHWVSSPGDMKAAFKPDAPETAVIKAIPSTWDETIVLPGAKIGEYAPFARRKGQDWFIAAIYGGQGTKDASINLSFLPKGKYKAVILTDLTDKNDGWKVEEKTLTAGDTIDCSMRSSGGAVVWLTPVK